MSLSKTPKTIYLSLGSNLWRRGFLIKAVKLLERWGFAIKKTSEAYLTKPLGFRFQPSFVNQVIKAQTTLSPLEALDVIQRIEKKMGRLRLFPNAPRTIDIDVLFYNNMMMNHPRLIIPHPRLQERAFVLVPLCEIEPELAHPVTGLSARMMLSRVDKSGVRRWS